MTTSIENWRTVEVDAFLEPEAATNALEGAVETIRERLREMGAQRRSSGSFQPRLYEGEQLTVAIDNCEQLWMTDKDRVRRNAHAVETVGRLGRAARVQVDLRTGHAMYVMKTEMLSLTTCGTPAIRDLYESTLDGTPEGQVPAITFTVTD